MYVGNNDTINELILQSADTGSFSVSNLFVNLRAMMKETTASDGTVTFTCTGNRYTAFLMVQSNYYPDMGIYAIVFKKDSGTTVKSIIGNETLPTIGTDGSITVNMRSWSKAVLYTTQGDLFS